MVVTATEIVSTLRALGFYDFLLPWVFAFAVVYGLLMTVKLFEEKVNKKRSKVEFTSNFKKGEYYRAIQKILHYIREGDIYQVNLSQRFELSKEILHVEELKDFAVEDTASVDKIFMVDKATFLAASQ